MTASTLTPFSTAGGHGILARRILADGHELVVDFETSGVVRKSLKEL
jgi:hypothetical protein